MTPASANRPSSCTGSPRSPRERARSSGAAPRDVLSIDVRRAELRGEPGDDSIDDGAHLRRGAEHARHRRDTAVGDPARHDVTEHREVGVDVEREAVAGAAARDAHSDRGDLLVADPHARVARVRARP